MNLYETKLRRSFAKLEVQVIKVYKAWFMMVPGNIDVYRVIMILISLNVIVNVIECGESNTISCKKGMYRRFCVRPKIWKGCKCN